MISEHNANRCFLRPSVTTELEMRDQFGIIFLGEYYVLHRKTLYLLAEHKFVLRFAVTKGAKLFQISVSLRLP